MGFLIKPIAFGALILAGCLLRENEPPGPYLHYD